MKNKFLFISLAFLFLLSISFISAGGLKVIESPIFVNKSSQADQTIIINIKNEASFKFYNVSLESNPYATMNIIPEILPNETKSVSLTVTSIEDINVPLKIFGYYPTQIGSSFLIHEVEITYPAGVNLCSFTGVIGDTVKWKNLVLDNVKLINLDTNNEITTIAQGQNYSSTYNSPIQLNYATRRGGFNFGPQCIITIISDTGYVTNPDYDAILNLNIDVVYPPTAIELSYLETSYTLSPMSQTEGLMSVKNIGTQTAKGILFEGEWFSFSPNSFDLAPGESRGLIYTLKPNVQFTNQTNKTYIKQVNARGNFPTNSVDFTIFLNYQEITQSQNQSFGEDAFFELIARFCEENRKSSQPLSFCLNSATFFMTGNASSQEFDYPMTIEKVDNFYRLLYEDSDFQKIFGQIILEKLNLVEQRNNETSFSNQNLTQELLESKKENEKIKTSQLVFQTLFFFAVIGWILFYLWQNQKKKNLEEKYKRW